MNTILFIFIFIKYKYSISIIHVNNVIEGNTEDIYIPLYLYLLFNAVTYAAY